MEGHWGFNKLEKYNEEYFLESDTELDSLCPFTKPKWCECPHYTTGNPVKSWWNTVPQIYINESTQSFELPDEISIKSGTKWVYYYSGIETAREIIRDKVMLVTNYIPIVIKNFMADGKQNKFLQLLLPEVDKIGRVIILETGGIRVPVESFVQRVYII